MSNFVTDGVRVSQLEEALQSLEAALESAPSDPDILAAVDRTRRALATARAQLSRSSAGFVTP